jgi:hypothetical protein
LVVQLKFGALGDGEDAADGEGVLGDFVEAAVVEEFAAKKRFTAFTGRIRLVCNPIACTE